MKTQAIHHRKKVRRAYYLSLEYLMGRLLLNNLHNSGLYGATRDALSELGQDFQEIASEEADMGLGNGGLGRLAACFLDSLALDRISVTVFTTSSTLPAGVCRWPPSRASRCLAGEGCLGSHATKFQPGIQLYGRVEHQMDDSLYHPKWVSAKRSSVCLLTLGSLATVAKRLISSASGMLGPLRVRP